MRQLVIAGVGLFLVVIFGPQFFYTVDQTQFAVVTRFGEIKDVKTTPGLKVKLAFADTVTRLDKRLLRIDVPPSSMPDRENQFLEIDAYVRYRIEDPRKFRQTLVDEITAASRISNIVTGELRAEIGQKTRPEIIGGQILTDEDGRPLKDEESRNIVQPLEPDGVPIREAITRAVRDRSDQRVKSSENDFGITIVDVRIKRADFPAATEESIFTNMRRERSVQANRLRAEGEEEFLRLTANVNRLVEVIAAEADEESSTLRGEGEGEAIRILASSLCRAPEFFAFQRSLEAYKTALTGKTTVVLSSDSPLFRYLQTPGSLALPGIDNSRPTVSLSYGSTSVGADNILKITATFGEPINCKPTIAIDTEGTDLAPVAMTDTGEKIVWNYFYVVPSGSEGTATVTIANATDDAGNPNSVATNDAFTIESRTP